MSNLEKSTDHLIIYFDSPMPLSHFDMLPEFLGQIESFVDRDITQMNLFRAITDIRDSLDLSGFKTIHLDLNKCIDQWQNDNTPEIFRDRVTGTLINQINKFAA